MNFLKETSFLKGKARIETSNLAVQALVLSELLESLNQLILIVTPDSLWAEQLYRQVDFFLTPEQKPYLHFYPSWETLPYDMFSPHAEITSERFRLLNLLSQQSKGLLILPATTLLNRLAPTHYTYGQCFKFKTGDSFVLREQRKRLVEAGYAQVDSVTQHGEFSLKGSLIDLFPMSCDYPLRIDLFDDVIDSIRTFDPQTQRTVTVINEFQQMPAHEYPLTPQELAHFNQAFLENFDVDTTECPLFMTLNKKIASPGAEYFLPLFFDKTATLFDYLPKNLFLVFSGALMKGVRQFWLDAQSRYDTYSVDPCRPILPPASVFLNPEQVFECLNQYSKLTFEAPQADKKEAHYKLPEQPLPDLKMTQKGSFHTLSEFIKTQSKVLLVAESSGRQAHLLQTLAQHQITPTIVSDWHAFYAMQEIDLGIMVAPIEQGLWWTEAKIAILTENELFGTPILTRKRLTKHQKHFKMDDMIRHLTELEVGALVVHLNHGIGRYDGLMTMMLDSQQQEFLKLLYADQDTLYVPVSDLELISRYSGANADSVVLHKLGSRQWSKARQKASDKIKDTAVELLDIYARREAGSGEAMMCSERDYHRFISTFSFETTPDQQQAIDEVLSDLKRKQPMDRIVCGDVGFGKTEVAMRAAFIACQSNKQVAILTPTTLLAQQHYDNFLDRFSTWPIRVEVISRFKRPKEVELIKAKLKSGHIDIIIGTHKLLSKDIQFHDLGLLIIDEEHRFGVNQKEHLKSIRSQVNILMLTATPIPRTLNMAMSRIRDLSIIATPPDKRLAIKTFVKTENDHIIREAILRELLRGGQVYYLHNEVTKIEDTANKIQTLVPEVRVSVAHGQMRERELEQVMKNFYHKKSNVLVCTTIIETGLDIPHANTIIIQNANRFGLAQLHQLRGRVGRSNHQAYAYLLLAQDVKISKNAEKRLGFIAESNQLGSGFMLATHDLEIRGAGELLGENQTGEIAAIGFSLYADLLEKTVNNIRQGKAMTDLPLEQPVEVNLQVSALIPDVYISSPHERLVIYKRMASCKTESALSDLKFEMIDRFGRLPLQTNILFEISNIKLLAVSIGITKIIANDAKMSIVFSANNTLDPAKFIAWIQSVSKQYQFIPPSTLNYQVKMSNPSDKVEQVFSVLKALMSLIRPA